MSEAQRELDPIDGPAPATAVHAAGQLDLGEVV